MRRRASLPLFALLAGLGLVRALAPLHLALNTSPSLPVGLYCLHPPLARRASLVLLCLPPRLALLARWRGYLGPGACPTGTAPLGKVVVAVAGDLVEVTRQGLSVNGRPLPGSKPRRLDGLGLPLPAYPEGAYRVAAGELWVLSPFHPLAWDSRYFGPLPESAVVARAAPLLVAGAAGAPPGFRLRRLEPRTH